ncbi:MAG: pentapeptide repeat-containing protein [Cyanobacteria bacterium J06621_12]
MACPEQLELIKKNVAKWNDWRKDNLNIEVDLSKADFSGLDLSGANFSEVNLSGAKFFGANLSGADFRDSNLQKTNFAESQLEKAAFFRSNLQDAYLFEANLSEANLSEANLSEANLSETNLKNTSFVGSRLEGANFENADLTGSKIATVYFSKTTSLKGANLANADLSNSENYQLDKNYIRGTAFKPFTQENWLVLKRKYTGAWFFIILILTLVFFGTFAIKALFWVLINDAQSIFNQSKIDIAKFFDKVPVLSELLIDKISSLKPCLQLNCKPVNIFSIVFEYQNSIKDIFPQPLLSIILFVYNLFRGALTFYVVGLRAEQEISGYTPSLEGRFFGIEGKFLGFKLNSNIRWGINIPLEPIYRIHNILEILKWISLFLAFREICIVVVLLMKTVYLPV